MQLRSPSECDGGVKKNKNIKLHQGNEISNTRLAAPKHHSLNQWTRPGGHVFCHENNPTHRTTEVEDWKCTLMTIHRICSDISCCIIHARGSKQPTNQNEKHLFSKFLHQIKSKLKCTPHVPNYLTYSHTLAGREFWRTNLFLYFMK